MRALVAGSILLLVSGGCGRKSEAPHPPPSSVTAPPPAPQALPGPSTLPPSDWTPPPSAFRGSVYDLSPALTDQDGKATRLDVFRGHPVIITMFYASCPNACPLLTSDIKKIDRQLSPEARERVRVLMVSFDAPRDTPEKLSKFMSDHGLDAARYRLASAPEDSARELAAVLGIRYRKLDNGEYFHSSSIILLDEQGKPVARVEGIGKDPAPILAVLH